MVICLYGPDSYRITQRLNVLRDAFIEKFDEKGLNVAQIDGEDFSIDTLRKHVRSGGLFGARRFVALRHVWKLTTEQQDQLYDELDTIPEDTIFCVTGDNPPKKNNRLFKRLQNVETVEEYAELTPSQVRTFIQETVAELESTIEPGAVAYLVDSIGNNLWKLHAELKKLSTKGNITLVDVQEVVDEAVDDNIFHLTDALGNRNVKQATELLQAQFNSGAHPQYLLTMLARHLATLAKVQKGGGKGLGLHPFVLQKSQKQQQQFAEDELQNLYAQLLDIDARSKTESVSEETLLLQFISDACSKNA